MNDPRTDRTTAETERPRLLFLMNRWQSAGGGIQTVNRELACAVASRFPEYECVVLVTVASDADRSEARSHGVRLIAGTHEDNWTGALLSQDLAGIGSKTVRAVIGHSYFSGGEAHHLRDRFFPQAINAHFIHMSPVDTESLKEYRKDRYVAEREEKLEREIEIAQRSDLVVCFGPLLRRYMSDQLNARGVKVSVVAITGGFSRGAVDRHRPERPTILCLGRTESVGVKGLDFFAHAAGLLIKKWRSHPSTNTKPHPTFIVRGARSEPETLERKLNDLARAESGTTPGIRVRPYTTNPADLRADYLSASVFMMPSRAEGYGLVACEALSLGVPTLISSSAGLAEVVRKVADKHHLKTESCVIDHDDDPTVTATRYAEAALNILLHEEAAETYVRQLREHLAGTCSWDAAASQFMSQLEAMRAAAPAPTLASTPSSVAAAAATPPTPEASGAVKEPADAVRGEPGMKMRREEAAKLRPNAPPVPPAGHTTPKPRPSRPHYRGLNSYRPEDAPYFFGRDDDIKRLVGALTQPSVQTLHLKGGSGVGKSSLVLAGLLPRLEGGATALQNAIVFKPGTDPFRSLARAIDERRPSLEQVGEAGYAALAERLFTNDDFFCTTLAGVLAPSSPDARRVIYIDQLEELLLTGRDGELSPGRNEAFAARLCAFLNRDPRNALVTSIRTDRDDLLGTLRWRLLGQRLAQGRQEWIYPPDMDDGLAEIVTGPAQLAGLDVEPQLIKLLRTEVRNLQSWPPLLGAVLEEIARSWESTPEHERRPWLTREHHRAVGGLAAVIGRRTRVTMDSLTEKQRQEVLPRLFSLLIRLDDQGRAMKRRFPISRFEPGAPERVLLERLVERRLLVDEGEVEIVHDLLFQVWPELTAWIRRHADDVDELSDIEHQARRWSRRGRTDHELLAPDRLARAERALATHDLRAQELPTLKDFVQRSRQVRDKAALLTAIQSADDIKLVTLLDRGVELDGDQLNTLELGNQLVFYYALFPERIPRRKTGTTSISAGFAQAGAANDAAPLLDYFTEENIQGHVSRMVTVQHFAALAGRVDVLKRLHKLGADLMVRNDRKSTPLGWAVFGGNVEAVKWLVSLGREQADQLVERGNRFPLLHRAAMTGQSPMIDYLLENGALVEELDELEFTTLGNALRVPPSPPVILRLLEAGANPNTPQGEDRYPPIVLAAYWRDASTIEALLARGADPNSLSREGWGPLGMLITRDLRDLTGIAPIRVLLDRGANPNLPNSPGRHSPLALASERGQTAIVEVLLAHGANVNAKGDDGSTPLFRAIDNMEEETIRALAATPGVDLELPNSNGRSPLWFALERSAWQIAMDLLDAGAKIPPAESSAMFEMIMTSHNGNRNAQVRLAERMAAAGATLAPLRQLSLDKDGRVIGWSWQSHESIRASFLERLAASPKENIWSVPPILDGAWAVLDQDAAAEFLARAVASKAISFFRWSGLAVNGVRHLPFALYNGGWLYEVSLGRREGGIGYLTLLATDLGITHFDGRSARIHELNEHGVLRMASVSEARDYLRLFCASVMGGEGAFTIFERSEQLHALTTMTEEQRAQALAVLGAPQLESEGNEERRGRYYVLRTPVKYGTDIFNAQFRVFAAGEIEMTNDEPLLRELDVACERINQNGLRIVVERAPSI